MNAFSETEKFDVAFESAKKLTVKCTPRPGSWGHKAKIFDTFVGYTLIRIDGKAVNEIKDIALMKTIASGKKGVVFTFQSVVTILK